MTTYPARLVVLAILLVLFATLLGGCELSKSDTAINLPDTLLYPFDSGNGWTYSYQSSWERIDDTPLVFHGKSVVAGLGEETLENEQQALGLYESWKQWLVSGNAEDREMFADTMSGEREDWYQLEEDGLYQIAYSNASSLYSTPKRDPNIYYRAFGRTFSSLSDVLLYASSGVPLLPTGEVSKTIASGSLTYETHPPLVLQYPLEIGATWYYRTPGNPWAIEKEVVGIERVEVKAGTFDCFLIQARSDVGDNGDIDMIWTEGFSKSGLVFRDVQTLSTIIEYTSTDSTVMPEYEAHVELTSLANRVY